jgi:hypothetical protein
MGWCAGDLVSVLGINACTFDTVTGAVLLCSTGLAAVVYLQYCKNLSSCYRVERVSWIPGACVIGFAALLFLSHLAALIADLLHRSSGTSKSAAIAVHPARLFSQGAFLLFYVAVVLLFSLGISVGVPVPRVFEYAVALSVTYALQVVFFTAENDDGSDSPAMVALGALQCTSTVTLAVFSSAWCATSGRCRLEETVILEQFWARASSSCCCFTNLTPHMPPSTGAPDLWRLAGVKA